MYYSCRGTVEMSLFASFVQCEGTTDACVDFPSVVVVYLIFCISKGGVFLLCVVAVAVAAEYDGRPT